MLILEMLMKSDAARIVLYCIAAVGLGEDSAIAVEWLQDQNLLDSVSPKEMAFLTNESPAKRQLVEASWRVESLWTLLWSAGKMDALEFPTETCDVNKVQDLMPIPGYDCGSFMADVKLRNLDEILDQTDLIYRIHWAIREAQLVGGSIPGSIIPGVVYERHYAFNWLIRYSDQWDDIIYRYIRNQI